MDGQTKVPGMPQLRRLVVRGGRGSRPVHSMWDCGGRSGVGYVFLQVLRFYPVIPPLLHVHTYIIWGMGKEPVSGPVSLTYRVIK